MKLNHIFWMTLLVFSSIFPHDVSCAARPTFDFPSGIILEKSCGLEDQSDFWSMTGSLTIPDMTDFSGEAFINFNNLQLCRIDLNKCTSVPSSSSYCYCNSKNSKEFGLAVRQVAQVRHNSATIEATYASTDIFAKDREGSAVIGQLPIIYKPYKLTYEKDGIAQGELLTKTVSAKSSVNLTICVENLVAEQDKPIKLKLNDSEEERTKVPACISKQFNPEEKLNFTFIETAACRRSKTFIIDVVQELPAGTESKGSNIALIVVGILAAGLVVFGAGLYFTRRNQGGQQEENLDARQEEAGPPEELVEATPSVQVESLASSLHQQPSEKQSEAPATSWFPKWPGSGSMKAPDPVSAAGPASTGGASLGDPTTESS